MWVPKDPTVFGEASARTYPLYVINDLLKTFQARATLIKKWNETGGVMILGFVKFTVSNTNFLPPSILIISLSYILCYNYKKLASKCFALSEILV